MLAVISPAKTLDFDSKAKTPKFTQPQFTAQSAVLIERLRELDPPALAQLMNISSNLAQLNHNRYQDWQLPFTNTNAKQAILAFKGEVYLGLQAQDYSERDFTWAQKHLRILSGLHGLLRPLDLIQPYRLEMGTKLQVKQPQGVSRNLYEFWGDSITQQLNEALAQQAGAKEKQPVLLNLASKEYFSAVVPQALKCRVITPQFLDLKNGQYKFLSFFAKKARGYMASYLIRNRIKSVKQLQSFNDQGYRYCPERSTTNDWVFLRDSNE